MLFEKRECNPYYVNGKELSKIIFYDESGVVFKTHNGWFGDGDNRIGNLELDGTVINKRKVDYNLKVPYLIKDNDIYDPRHILYYPFFEDDWDIEQYELITNFKKEHHDKFSYKKCGIVQDYIQFKEVIRPLKDIDALLKDIEEKADKYRREMYRRDGNRLNIQLMDIIMLANSAKSINDDYMRYENESCDE